MSLQRIALGVVCAAMAGGCMVGPNYRPPETQSPATWSGVQPELPTTQPAVTTTRPAEVVEWWKSLHDPVLDSLVERAMGSNLDLRLARARVAEARASRGVVAADLWPQVSLGGSYAYRGGSRNAGPRLEDKQGIAKQARNRVINSAVQSALSGGGAPDPGSAVAQAITGAVSQGLQGDGPTASRDQNLFQFGFDASWELDIFGGNRRAVEAAEADIAATEENLRDVQVTLLSEVALNYVQLRGYQRRLEIARRNIRIQQDTLELIETKFGAGFANRLEVAQARTQLAATQSQVPALRSAIRQTIFQISVLLAQSPGALLAELEQEAPIPSVPPEVPVGLPSDLLRRRPDIRSAERLVAAANARVGEATADLFPQFSLTGNIGPQSRTTRHLLDRQSLAWSVGPGVTWPVFDGWRIRSNIRVQDARYEQALVTYEQTVLIAFQEVENALTAYTDEQIRRESLLEAVEASQQSTSLSYELYDRGWKDFLNVLESQRALYSSQDELAQSETAVVTNLISLYKALGGGWSPEAPSVQAEQAAAGG